MTDDDLPSSHGHLPILRQVRRETIDGQETWEFVFEELQWIARPRVHRRRVAKEFVTVLNKKD